jgi:hypothetical protein
MIHIRDTTEASDKVMVETIDIYKVYSVHNVSTYSDSGHDTFNISCYEPSDGGDMNYYFALDGFFNDAFAHWIFESAIYLPLFRLLQQRHPHIKLFTKSRKTYTRLFCNYLGFSDADMVYTFDTTCPSICYFASPISSLIQNEITEAYKQHVDRFWDMFRADSVEMIHPVAVLPRQQKENYQGNDRVIPFDTILQYTSRIKDSVILHTDTVTDLAEQIAVIHGSAVIVVTDGSPFLVNGMFSYNKHILVSGQCCTYGQAIRFKKIAYIIDKIKRQNLSASYIETQGDTCNRLRDILRI